MAKKNDNLDFDLDALLQEFEEVSAEETGLSGSDTDLGFSLDDLDQLLNDGPVTEKAEAPAPSEKKKKQPARKPEAKKNAPAVKKEESADLNLDELDHLLEEISQPQEAAPVPKKQPHKAKKPSQEEQHVPKEPAAQQEESPKETPAAPEMDAATMDTVNLMAVIQQITGMETSEPAQESTSEESAVSEEPTIRMEPVTHATEEKEAAVSEDATIRLSGDESASLEEQISQAIKKDAEDKQEEAPAPSPIAFMSPRAKLHLLKKQLVAGPEKRYYELSEIGSGKLQIAALICLILVLLCAGTTTLFTMGFVPENRLRLVIFSQVFAMLVSALMGSQLMMDAIGNLFKARFTPNTLLVFTFLVCCVDAVFCFQELRVPCCAAFSLEMTMALWARYHRRTTEMGQMDTLRKAVKLTGLIREPDFYEGNPGVLRQETDLKHFMDHYNETSGPEKLQNLYALLALPLCIAVAAFTGMIHGFSTAIQILAVSLLVAVPASFFISLTRPMAVLEKRLHMVGTVLCGWQGVKKLCGKLAFPIRDGDLFPLGSTKLNGVKFYGDRNPDQVVSYSTSLVTAVGSGLAGIFEQLLSSRDGTTHSVSNIQSYNGGIGGEVQGVSVLMGNLDFLQDMGVEVPQGSTVAQAVYAAIDGELSAVYAVTYAKMRSASAGLVSLSGCKKLTSVLTGGDFMLTDSFLQEKFNIKTKHFAFPDQETRKELAGHQADPEAVAAAISTREDLVSAAYAVSGARALNRANRLGVAIHLTGGILGLLMMAVLGYLGSTELLTPTHVLLYQLVWLVPGFLITEWTRTV